MISDIILIIIVLLFVALGVKRGIAKTILNIVGIAVTYLCASYLSSIGATEIYKIFLKQGVINNINSFISTNGIEYAIDNCLNALPEWINTFVSVLLSLLGGDFQSFISYSKVEFANASSATAATIEPMVRAAAETVIGIILFVLLFIIAFILTKKLIKLIAKLFKLPVISQVNSFLGGLLGAFYGLIVAFIAVNIAGVLLVCASPEIISNETIIGALFKFLCLTI